MVFVLRREGDTENPSLPTVYGKQSTYGRLVYYTKHGNRTCFLSVLGEGEMDGLDEVRYNGRVLVPYNLLTGAGHYVFHPGTKTVNPAKKLYTADPATDTFTSAAHGFAADLRVRVSMQPPSAGTDGAFPDPLTGDAYYYVRNPTADTFQLSDAAGGAPLNITSAGAGTQKVFAANAGFDDPVQGRPTIVSELLFTFSEICYIEVILDPDIAADGEPDKLEVRVRGKKINDYDGAGNVIGYDFSANNARVAADIAFNKMQIPATNEWWDFPSWVQFRDRCDGSLSWGGGTVPSVPAAPAWQSTINCDTLAAGAVTKNAGGSAAWNSGAMTVQPATAGDCFISWVADAGRFMVGLSSQASISEPTYAAIDYALYMENAGAGLQLKIYSDGVPMGTFGHWAPGDRFKVALESGVAKFYQNDTLIDTSALSLPLVSYPVRGVFAALAQGSRASSILWSPMSAGGTPRQVVRFNAHVAFSDQMDAINAFQSVMVRCPGVDWQDVGGKIVFLTIPSRPVSHRFTYDPTQPPGVGYRTSNIVADSFECWRKSPDDKINFVTIEYRDLDDPVYTKKYVQNFRPRLMEQAKQVVDAGILPMGVMEQSLADRIAESLIRVGSDLDTYVRLKGQAGCYHVAKGDVVEVSHDIVGWREAGVAGSGGSNTMVKMMVIEESFDSSLEEADTKSFLLQLYDPNYYSDTDHGPLVVNPVTDLPSPTIPPPPVSWPQALSVVERIMPDGTRVQTIQGLAQFSLAYNYPQRGRLYWQRPGDPFPLPQPITLTPDPLLLEAPFELSPAGIGTHFVRVIPETSLGNWQRPESLHPLAARVVTAPSAVLPQVSAVVGTIVGNKIRWTWTPPANQADVGHYEIYTSYNAALGVPAGLGGYLGQTGGSLFEQTISGAGTYTIFVVAVARWGAYGSPVLSAPVTVAVLPTVTSFRVISFNGTHVTLDWDAPADPEGQRLGFQVTDISGTQLDFAASGPVVIAHTARSVTYKIRAVSVNGNSSAFASVTYTAAPVPVPAVSKGVDTPSSLVINLARPVGNGGRPEGTNDSLLRQISYTRIDYSVSPTFASGVFSETVPGAPEQLLVTWNPGTQFYFRVRYESIWGDVTATSAALSHTFTRYLDNAIDPGSQIARAALSRIPMMSGGGTILWTGTLLSWDAAFIVAPLPANLVPPSLQGALTIAAQSTAPAANQIVVARYTVGSTAAPAILLAPLSTYQYPTYDTGFFDVWLAHRRSDSSIKLYNGNVLAPGQSVQGDTFIPFLSVIGAMIQDATITNAKIHDLRADKIFAALGTFGIIFTTQFLSTDWKQHMPQTQKAVLTRWRLAFNTIDQQDGSIQNGVGWDGWGLAGASSELSLYVASATIYGAAEFLVKETTTYRQFGLAYKDEGYGFADIDFAFYAQPGGVLTIMEGGGTTPFTGSYAQGDLLEIRIEWSVALSRMAANYYQNGVKIYGPSSAFVRFPLAVDTAFYTSGATSGISTLRGQLQPSLPLKVTWKGTGIERPDLTAGPATVGSNGDVTKTGTIAADDCTVSNTMAQAAGDMFGETDIFETNKQRGFGLASGAESVAAVDIDFMWYFLGDGFAYAYDHGTVVGVTGLAAGDTFRVSIEGGVPVWRKNGFEQARAVGAVLTYPYRVEGVLRSPGATLRNTRFGHFGEGRGWRFHPSQDTETPGRGEIHGGVQIKYGLLDEAALRSLEAITASRDYKGADSGKVPVAALTTYEHFTQSAEFEDDRARFSLSLGISDRDLPANNTDSIDHVRLRVLSKFGAPVLPGGEAIVLWRGWSVVGEFAHARAGADPWEEAVYSVEIFNYFGSTPPIFFSVAPWTTYQGGATGWVNRGTAPPAYLNPNACATALTAAPVSEQSVQLSWTPPGSATAVAPYYRKFKAAAPYHAWVLPPSPAGDNNTTGAVLITGLEADTRYEFMVETQNGLGYHWSNYAAARTVAVALPQAVRAAPSGLTAAAVSTTQVNLVWTRNATDNTGVIVQWRDVTTGQAWGANADIALGVVTSYSHTGLTADHTYEYRVKNTWGSAPTESALSNVVSAHTPATAPANLAPSGLTATPATYYRIDLTWSKNDGDLAYVEWKVEGAATWNRIPASGTLAAGQHAYSHTGLLMGTGYRYRVFNTSPSLAGPSNEALASTDYYDPPDPGGCLTLSQRVLAVEYETQRRYWKRAGEVEEGDWLICIAADGLPLLSRVKRLVPSTVRRLVRLHTEGGAHLECSETQPVLRGAGDRAGVAAASLRPGDTAFRFSFASLRAERDEIVGCEIIETTEDVPVIIWEMEEREHTFVAEGLVVHNLEQK